MTNKEAIELNKELLIGIDTDEPEGKEMFEALKMAIYALKSVTINSDPDEIKVTNCNYNDSISRQAAIDEIEYELEMINSALDSITLDFNARERLRQRRGEAREILNSIQELPPAQPEEDCDTCKHGYFGGTWCNNCKVRFPSHYERRTDD